MYDEFTPDELNEPAGVNGQKPGESGESGDGEAAAFLRDLSEDDVYSRLQSIPEFPTNLSALENRLSGAHGELAQRLATLEKGLPTRASLDVERVTKALAQYDDKLAEVLGPVLQEAFQVHALDENTLRPYLEPLQQQISESMGEQLVMSAYAPETLAEIIPPVKDGRFVPEGQRHKDFIDWYGQQGYTTQQALLSFGAPYINALRKFERWEKERNERRTGAANGRTQRLENGQVPTGQNRKAPQPEKLSPADAFLAGFNESRTEAGR